MSNIGRIKLTRDTVENGQYGKLYHGCYEDEVDVSVVRVDKSQFKVDKKLLQITDVHPNIIRFYGSEEDEEFQ